MDTEEQLDEDEAEDTDEEAPADGEAPADAEPETTRPGRKGAGEDGDVESLDQIVKKEARNAPDEEEETGLASSAARDEKLEPLAVKVVPPQETEFVCKRCYLVKHRSQLKDVKRKLCRDCA